MRCNGFPKKERVLNCVKKYIKKHLLLASQEKDLHTLRTGTENR